MQVFDRRALVMVPNSYWTGDECDLLVVRNDLRLVDVEVKISRSDLRRDQDKGKWVDVGKYVGWNKPREPDKPREWPRKVWKHYYALPADIWRDSLEECIPKASGVIFMRLRGDGRVGAFVHRQAKPCPGYERLTPEQVVDIARTLTVRYWSRFGKVRG